MSDRPRIRARLAQLGAAAVLLAACTGLALALVGTSGAAPPEKAASKKAGSKKAAPKKMPGPSTKPRPYGILRLDRKGRYPAKAIPTVARAKRAERAQSATRLGGATREDLELACPALTVDVGTWCVMSATVDLEPEQAGAGDYLFASRHCASLGGWLPTAEQLVGVADRVKLSSTIDDDRLTASIDENPTDGLKDRQEMTGSLVTTRAGSAAAGSPSDPEPQALQYVTVFDNRNRGGFAGSRPITQPERFRCAFPKGNQGEPEGE